VTDHTDRLVEMPDIAEVRTNVLVAVGEVAHPLVAVTSARDDISRRDVAVKLAGSIARTGRRVTLIDADMTDRGQATDESAAWTLITARAVSEADPAMLVSEAFHRCLVDTAAANDLVVVACPPILDVAETRAIAVLCTGTLMVASERTSSRDDTVEAATILRVAGARILGVVLRRS